MNPLRWNWLCKLVMLLAMLLNVLNVTPAGAQDYPVKSMRVAVGFAAGGPADAMARIIGKKMTDISGQSVIIDNRPGSNGFIAGDFVARSAPDGDTGRYDTPHE